MSTTLHVLVELPDDQLVSFVQQLRDFEQQDPTAIHVRIKGLAYDTPVDTLYNRLMAIAPAINVRVIERKPGEN